MKRKSTTGNKTRTRGASIARREKSRATAATNSAPPPAPGFREVLGLIQRARAHAFQTVNTELIDLYWRADFSQAFQYRLAFHASLK
jgi:hypothetical protein